MPGMPWVEEGRLKFPGLTRESIMIGNAAWSQWLNSPETTSFRFESEATAFTARRESRRGHAYWYAYRRRGRQLLKVYLGRSDAVDLDRLAAAAVRLSSSASPGQTPTRSVTPLLGRIEAGYVSRLPAPATRLIGRERDIATTRAILLADSTRLVTLTGAGGTGKTRLAVELANQLSADFRDGVVFVDLAPLSNSEQVVPAVAHALGLRDLGDRPVRDGAYEWLRPRHMLLLLDNFEHLLAAAAELADLLTNCPQVTALVTSREALRLRWERLVVVPPLDLPDSGADETLERIANSPAAMLFAERARGRNPLFQLTIENASAVAEICARLDGLPLAIELAAARASVLTPRELALRLNPRLPALGEGPRDAPTRQRTLRNAIGWSHDLLSLEDQVFFRRLAVFAGGFTLAAAEAVAGGPGERSAGSSEETPTERAVLDRLQSLVDKSLLKTDTYAGEMRFRLLETVREFGTEQLVASGEAEALRDRHATYCLALIRQINADPDEVARLDRLEREHDNMRAALRWALEGGELLVGLRLAAALRRFWWRRGYLGEGRRWIEQLLARASQDRAVCATREWATALGAAGYLAWAQADYTAALEYHREATACWEKLGDGAGLAAARGFIGTTLCWQGELRRARPVLEQSLAAWRRLGHTIGTANALFQLGLIALFEHQFTNAHDRLSEALALHQEAHSVTDACYDATMLGFVAVQQGELAEARKLLKEARDVMLELDDHWGALFLLECAGALATAEGDAARALRLVGVASALRERTGVPLPPAHRAAFEPWFMAARTALPSVEAEAATQSGRTLVPGQSISAEQLRALLTDDAAKGAPDNGQLGVLTRREQEIAACVARGWTNQGVADTLIVSRRTVETHLSHILYKLGLTTRAQVAVWAAQNGLLGAPSKPCAR